jgi:phospholipid/cholesterol/gamma-HCH transport system substrate-binding protein
VKPAVTKALAVGSLVAVTGTAFLFAFTFFKKGGYSKSESYLVTARFSDATGLTWRSRVQIAGIQVGEVESISLANDKAVLAIRIKNDVVLHSDACLYKTFPSALLPDALLDVAPGSSSAPSLQAEPEDRREITCIREATSVQQLLDSMSKIANDVSVVTGDLADTVRGNQGSLKNVVQNLAATTARLREIVEANDQNVTQILRNTRDFTRDLRDMSARDKDRIHDILVNVEQLTAELRTTATSLQGVISGVRRPGPAGQPGGSGETGPGGAPGLAGTSGAPGAAGASGAPGTAGASGIPGAAGASAEQEAKGVQQAVEKLNDNLAKLDDILGKVQEGKSVAGRLLVDERMGRQVGNTVEGLSDYFDRVNKIQVQLHLRSEALLNQSVSEGRPGAKVYFGARLIPRPDKYYELELVSDPRGVDTLTTTTDVTTINGGSPTTTVRNITQNEQKLAFSLQMAKRYGPLNLRGGVIESSGGVGTDLYLLNDSLRFSLSVFQFNRPKKEAFPRAKLWADYVFLKHLYITAGADDFLNRWSSSQRAGGRPFNIGTDVFFGGGLEFNDEDLKTLMGAGVGSTAAAAAH